MKSAVKGVQQFEKELNVTHEVQDITLLMSYVALKASEVVLDGHREVLLAVLPLHFYRESAELSCWRLSLRRIPAGTLSVELLVALLAQAQSWNNSSLVQPDRFYQSTASRISL